MSRYRRDEYGIEDLDEYEDEEPEEDEDGDEEDEGEEEEEVPQPTQEELDYLDLRKQFKESYRKQLQQESGSSLGNSQQRKKMPCDNYGSFFGPSQPVIAQRVIQESRSMLENEHLTARVSKSNNSTNKSNGVPKSHMHDSRPKVVNELRKKVQKLKDTRDYSFLLSDDAELPVPSKDPPRNVSGPKSEARSAQVPPKNKQSSSSNGRQVPSSSRQVPSSTRQVPNGRNQVRSSSGQVLDSSRQVLNGSRRVPDGSRQAPVSSRQASNSSRQGSSGHVEKRYVSRDDHDPRARPHKLNSSSKPMSKSIDSRIASNNGSGPGRPLGSKPVPSKVTSATLQKKVPAAGAKSSVPNAYKPPSTKSQSFAPNRPPVSKQSSIQKQPLDQRKGYQESAKGKMVQKQPVVFSKPQLSKPSAKNSSRPTSQKALPRKRPAGPFSDDEDDFGGSVSSMIHKLMGYNPNKYVGKDGDIEEANFDDIIKEEKESARIARKEDEEEQRKIEAEEEMERARKEAKKRKLSHR